MPEEFASAIQNTVRTILYVLLMPLQRDIIKLRVIYEDIDVTYEKQKNTAASEYAEMKSMVNN